MKKIFQTLVCLLLLMSTSANAQTVNICAGSSTVLNTPSATGLTNATYSMNPGGLTSVNGTFTVAPSGTTNFTLYTTGTNSNNALVTTSNVVSVVTNSSAFNLLSPQNFSLGCNTSSICIINITNASSQPVSGAPLSYTFIPPGGSTLVTFPVLSPTSSQSVNIPGLWNVGVMLNPLGCITWTQVLVQSNTIAPTAYTTSASQVILSCSNPSAQLQCSVSPGLIYSWQWPQLPGSVQNSPATVTANFTQPTATLTNNYTLVVTDVSNQCTSISTVAVLQNLFPPNPGITTGLSACQPSVVLTNVSTTGIPPGIFSSALAVVAQNWSGPFPQPSQTLTTTYVATVAGVYTLTAKDLNNGCEKSTTISVQPAATAAFVHTITGAQVNFNDVSLNTNSNTTYFWNFGDGYTSTLQNPVHTYTNGGAYLVKLKITDAVNFCRDSTMQTLAITGPPCVANAGFSLVPTATPQAWAVIPVSPWNVNAATWNWGDNSSSNTLYTSHQYSAAGMYNICLTVTVSCGATASACASYSVYRVSQGAQMVSVTVQAPELISGLNHHDPSSPVHWTILPNPASGAFSLQTDQPAESITDITIMDLQGKILCTHSVGPKQSRSDVIDLNLRPGLYLVKISDGNFHTVQRLVIMQ